MNEIMQKAIVDLINSSIANIEHAKNFILSEIPDILQQLIIYERSIACFYALISFFFITINVYFFIKHIKKIDFNTDDFESQHVIFIAHCFISLIGFIVGFMYFFDMDWLKIWVAPKIWLIEYASNLIK